MQICFDLFRGDLMGFIPLPVQNRFTTSVPVVRPNARICGNAAILTVFFCSIFSPTPSLHDLHISNHITPFLFRIVFLTIMIYLIFFFYASLYSLS